MVYPPSHPDPLLASQPKGIMRVLRERESVWHHFTNGGKKSLSATARIASSRMRSEMLLRRQRMQRKLDKMMKAFVQKLMTLPTTFHHWMQTIGAVRGRYFHYNGIFLKENQCSSIISKSVGTSVFFHPNFIVN